MEMLITLCQKLFEDINAREHRTSPRSGVERFLTCIIASEHQHLTFEQERDIAILKEAFKQKFNEMRQNKSCDYNAAELSKIKELVEQQSCFINFHRSLYSFSGLFHTATRTQITHDLKLYQNLNA